MTPLHFAYLANILILLPIAGATLTGGFPADGARFAESAGWRTIVGSFWLAILAVSVLGLAYPMAFAAVLVVQLIYKTCWLLTYAAPRLLDGRAAEVPAGIGFSFLIIAMVWPWIIPWSQLFSSR